MPVVFNISDKDKEAIEKAREMFFEGLAKKIVDEYNKNPEYWIKKIKDGKTKQHKR